MREVAVKWHKIVKRLPTDGERREYNRRGYKVPTYILDCEMPKQGADILVDTGYAVLVDTCCIDHDGHIRLLYGDWDDVTAWANLPKGNRNV